MSNESQEFDLLILGSGSGGYAAALRGAELGLSVGLIEKAELGGTCLHRGCIPTKTLLHAGEVADAARDSESFGVKVSYDGIDMDGVNKFKNNVISRNYKGLQGLVKSRGVTFIEGEGKLTGTDTIDVTDANDTLTYRGKNIVLATGSYSKTLPGLEIGGRVITSEQALQLDYVPERVAVLGGGVIGVEFASVWKSFGADVSVIEALPHLAPLEDESISKTLEREFKKRKINFTVGVKFQSVEQKDDGVVVTLEDGSTVEADLLLVAVGRGPVTENLGYEEAGVTMERGFVRTDERLHTGTANIYAVGDIVPGLQLAHRGFAQGIFVAEEVAGLKPAPVDESGIPRVTYCEPEITTVGLSEAQAKEKYGEDNIESLEYGLGGNGKSVILKTNGFVKLVREKNGPVVGVHAIGTRMSEQAGESQLVVNWEAFPEEVAQLIHAHPTQTEAMGEANLALAGKPLHFHS